MVNMRNESIDGYADNEIKVCKRDGARYEGESSGLLLHLCRWFHYERSEQENLGFMQSDQAMQYALVINIIPGSGGRSDRPVHACEPFLTKVTLKNSSFFPFLLPFLLPPAHHARWAFGPQVYICGASGPSISNNGGGAF